MPEKSTGKVELVKVYLEYAIHRNIPVYALKKQYNTVKINGKKNYSSYPIFNRDIFNFGRMFFKLLPG